MPENQVSPECRYIEIICRKPHLKNNIPYSELETYFNTLRRTPTVGNGERTNAAVNREIGTLRHMLRKAVEWDMIEQSPFTKGKSLRLKENNERLRFLSEDEIDRLLDVCAPWLRHLVIFCIHSGARRKEALNLKWHQIKNGLIYFEETKPDCARQVPISDELQEMLNRLRGSPTGRVVNLHGRKIEVGTKKEALVFTYQGSRIPNWKCKQDFKSACKRAKIPYGLKTPDGCTFHSLRHTFGSWLAIRKASLRTIQILMGHRDISMTMRYAHLIDDVKQEAVNLLNGLTTKNKCHPDGTQAKTADTTNMQPIETTPIF